MHVLKFPRVDNLHSKLLHGGIGRREFLGAAALAGVAPLTAGTPSPARAEEDGQINYFTWSGYELPELHASYVAKYGTSPGMSFFGSEEEALQKMRAGFLPDLSHPCVDQAPRWNNAGVLQPIDPTRLSNWPDMFASLHTMPGAVIDDQVYVAVCDFGLSSIIYRTDLYEGEETWYMLYDPRYEGRICARNSNVNLTQALLILGEDPWNPTDEALEKAADLARQQRGLVRMYWDSQTDMEQAIASGECVAGYAWNEAMVHLTEQGVPVAYANPKEGALAWACGLARIKDAPGDEQMAYDFIDAWLSPETGKFLIEEYGYGHSNQKSFEIADPAIVANLGYTDPEAMINDTIFFTALTPEQDDKQLKLWEEILAGM